MGTQPARWWKKVSDKFLAFPYYEIGGCFGHTGEANTHRRRKAEKKERPGFQKKERGCRGSEGEKRKEREEGRRKNDPGMENLG